MGVFKKFKKKLSTGTKSFGTLAKATVQGDFKLGVAAATRFTDPGSPLADKAIKAAGFDEPSQKGTFVSLKDLANDSDAFNLSVNQAAIAADSERAQAEERKHRLRRNNIVTKPLGALTSNAVLTRVLTGQ